MRTRRIIRSFCAWSLSATRARRGAFERCAFDTGKRPVLQAQREGRPIVRECLMHSTAMGLVNVSGGCLAAVVLDVPRDPFGPRPDGLAIDPRWFAWIGAGQSVPRELLLERSPLEGQ